MPDEQLRLLAFACLFACKNNEHEGTHCVAFYAVHTSSFSYIDSDINLTSSNDALQASIHKPSHLGFTSVLTSIHQELRTELPCRCRSFDLVCVSMTSQHEQRWGVCGAAPLNLNV